jgi:hypothetical protein
VILELNNNAASASANSFGLKLITKKDAKSTFILRAGNGLKWVCFFAGKRSVGLQVVDGEVFAQKVKWVRLAVLYSARKGRYGSAARYFFKNFNPDSAGFGRSAGNAEGELLILIFGLSLLFPYALVSSSFLSLLYHACQIVGGAWVRCDRGSNLSTAFRILDENAHECDAKSPHPQPSPLGWGEGDGVRWECLTLTSNCTRGALRRHRHASSNPRNLASAPAAFRANFGDIF